MVSDLFLAAAAQLWLCTYVTHDDPPKTYSVSYTDQSTAQGEAMDICMQHSDTCEFKGCKKWMPTESSNDDNDR